MRNIPQRRMVCVDNERNDLKDENVTVVVRKWFDTRNHFNAKSATPSPMECNQTHELFTFKLDEGGRLQNKSGKWQIAKWNFDETKDDYFDYSNSCIENVKTSNTNNELILVACRMTIDTACRANICVPFCCGSTLVANSSIGAEDWTECRKPNDRTEFLDPIEDGKFNLLVLENGNEVSARNSNIFPYYYKRDVNRICNMTQEKDANLRLIYENSCIGYQLKFDNDILQSNEYCIAQYETLTPNDNLASHEHDKHDNRIFKFRTCKVNKEQKRNKRWFKIFHMKIGPVLCGISALFLSFALVLEWKTKRFKLHGALKICLLSCNLLYFAAMSLKGIYPCMLHNYPNICVFFGFTEQFLFLFIMAWIAALSHKYWRGINIRIQPRGQQHLLGFYHPQFKWYLLISTGPPLFVTCITNIMMNYSEELPPSWIKPSIGATKCGFDGKYNKYDSLLYLTFPSAIILLAALTFICAMTVNICRSEDSNLPRTSGRPRVRSGRSTMKLLGFLGMFWSIDIISRIVEIEYGPDHTATLCFNSVFDSISYLNGVWLFLVGFLKWRCTAPISDEANSSRENRSSRDAPVEGQDIELDRVENEVNG